MFPPTKKRIMEGIRDLFKLSEATKQGGAKLTFFLMIDLSGIREKVVWNYPVT